MTSKIATSKPPSRKHKSQQRKTRSKPLQNKWRKRLSTLVAWTRWILGVGIPLVLAYETLYPEASMEASESLNSKMPLKTHFILKNESLYSLHNVFYSCELRKIFIGGVLKNYRPPGAFVTAMPVIAVPAPIESLPKSASQSLSCGSGSEPIFFMSEGEWLTVDKVFMDIQVFYSPGYISHSVHKTFYFGMLRDAEGHVQWLPTTPD